MLEEDTLTMPQEIWDAYIAGYGGLVCPFPRLEEIRARMKEPAGEFEVNEINWKEYGELLQKELDYYSAKTEAKLKFQMLYKEWKSK